MGKGEDKEGKGRVETGRQEVSRGPAARAEGTEGKQGESELNLTVSESTTWGGRLHRLICIIFKSLSFFPRQVTWSY